MMCSIQKSCLLINFVVFVFVFLYFSDIAKEIDGAIVIRERLLKADNYRIFLCLNSQTVWMANQLQLIILYIHINAGRLGG